jgi:hypothetical protein
METATTSAGQDALSPSSDTVTVAIWAIWKLQLVCLAKTLSISRIGQVPAFIHPREPKGSRDLGKRPLSPRSLRDPCKRANLDLATTLPLLQNSPTFRLLAQPVRP